MSTVEIPSFLSHLPLDRHGRPIPWFVHIDTDGTPDFRVIGLGKLPDAIRFGLCWVCGKPRGRHAAFVIGPMCMVNRVSAEPPAHLPCASFSATACPFLVTPSMRRRTTGLDGDLDHNTAGIAIERNPGVAVVWSSKTWASFRVGDHPNAGVSTRGILFDVGEPTLVSAYAAGRLASRAEVEASVTSGLPLLLAECERDTDPAGALEQLGRQVDAANRLLSDRVMRLRGAGA